MSMVIRLLLASLFMILETHAGIVWDTCYTRYITVLCRPGWCRLLEAYGRSCNDTWVILAAKSCVVYHLLHRRLVAHFSYSIPSLEDGKWELCMQRMSRFCQLEVHCTGSHGSHILTNTVIEFGWAWQQDLSRFVFRWSQSKPRPGWFH